MTLDDLRALADKFFVWPEGSGRQTVTTFSALLFAQHVLQLREKSLGTENSAGMDALRNAAQRQLDSLAAYRREIGLLTGVPDEQPCDAEVAARAALEQDELEGLVCARCGALAFDPVVPQQAEPVQPIRFRVTVVDNAHPDGIPLEQWVRRDPTAALRADAERYRYLLGHARRIDVAGWSISHMEQLSARIDAAREEP